MEHCFSQKLLRLFHTTYETVLYNQNVNQGNQDIGWNEGIKQSSMYKKIT